MHRASNILACSSCGTSLLQQAAESSAIDVCASCGAQLSIGACIFPAFLRKADDATPDQGLGGEASCFRHPGRKVAAVCDMCGRFLCQLCDIGLAGQHVCSTCIESGRKKKKIAALEHERLAWDSVAMALAICPLGLTAIAGLMVAVVRWNKPSSIVRQGRQRLILAVLVSLLQISAWVVLLRYAGK